MKRTWTDENIELLKENYVNMDTNVLAQLLGKSRQAVRDKANSLGIKRGRSKTWTQEENEYMRKHYPTTPIKECVDYLNRSEKSIYMQAKLLGIKKDKDYLSSLFREKMNSVFVQNMYKKGNIPLNKGVPMSKEKYEKCKETFFKKGGDPPNTNPEGDGAVTFRRNKDWYCYNVRISKGVWIPLHRYVWQQVNGPIPKGFIVTFKNGDYRDCRIDNLELMSRADNMRRNSLHNYPEDLKSAIQIKAGFNRKLNKIIKKYESQN